MFHEGGVLQDLEEIEDLDVIEMKLDKIERTLRFPVINSSGSDLKLKKGKILAEIRKVEEAVDEGDFSIAASETEIEVNFEELDIGLEGEERDRLKALLEDYHNKVKETPISEAKLPIQHEINLTDDIPTTCAPRLILHSRLAAVEKQIQALLSTGCIEKSSSPYSAPIVPVIKKDGSVRLCIDYRKLNTKTINNKFPIAKLEDLFDDLKGCECFSVIDLTSAYHHILVNEKDKHKTAFTTQDEKYQWIVMPFGLSGASFSLSSAMSKVLSDLSGFARNFFDDGYYIFRRVSRIILNIVRRF